MSTRRERIEEERQERREERDRRKRDMKSHQLSMGPPTGDGPPPCWRDKYRDWEDEEESEESPSYRSIVSAMAHQEAGLEGSGFEEEEE